MLLYMMMLCQVDCQCQRFLLIGLGLCLGCCNDNGETDQKYIVGVSKLIFLPDK
jgi:hypothetical protein